LGSGVQVPSAGLNINQDLSFQGVNAVNLRSTRFNNQPSPLAGITDLTCLYVSGNNLYYNNGVGNQVQITQGAGLDASTVGGFGGDYGTSTASAFYTSATSTFTFWSNANISAFMDFGQFTVHPSNSSTIGVTITAPTSLGSSYSIALPNAGPVANNSLLVFDAAGNSAFSETAGQGFNPPGTLIASMATATPPGYLYCNGAAVSRTTYSTLFAAIGTASGNGDGSTTFNVPDVRGYFLRGQTDGTVSDPDASSRSANNPGGNTGDNVGSVQSSAFASHTHTVTDPGHQHTERVGTLSGGGTQAIVATGNSGAGIQNTTVNATTATVTGITNQNTGASIETRPLNAYVRYYIKF